MSTVAKAASSKMFQALVPRVRHTRKNDTPPPPPAAVHLQEKRQVERHQHHDVANMR